MPPRRFHLKEGADPEAALGVLRDAIAEPDSFGFAHDALNFRIKYLEWTEKFELQLQHLTRDHEVLQVFQTPRHWHIRSSDTTTLARLHPLINAEIAAQRATLEQLSTDLTERVTRAKAASGQVAVLDSNILLEHLPPAEVNWKEVVGSDEVRLVVPLRVVEEVDLKKYDRRGDLAARARRVLPAIEGVISEGGSPGVLREGVTVEVPVDLGPRRRPDDGDREVLDTCRDLGQLSGQAACLVTADTAMRIRGAAEGIRVIAMPEKYERKRA